MPLCSNTHYYSLSIFAYSHWSRAYVEFSVFLLWREHMTNKSRICNVLTPSETNTRFFCHVLTPSELFHIFVMFV